VAHIETRHPDGKRRTKTYRVQWIDSATGSRRPKTFPRKTDAHDFIRRMENAEAAGQRFDPDAGRETLAAYGEAKWLPTIADLKPKTQVDYLSLWEGKVKPVLGDRSLREIEAADVEAFVRGLRAEGLSASRTRRALLVLSKILSLTTRDRRIVSNPADWVSSPTPRPRDLRVPTLEEIDAIASAVGSRSDPPPRLHRSPMGRGRRPAPREPRRDARPSARR
jgi:hypothetical protein